MLIVDDEPAVRRLLAIHLSEESDHFRVAGEAATAREGIESARVHQPDLALVDFTMPGGGPATVRGILQVSPRTTVVALSGREDPETVREMLRAGATTYLLKGMPVEEMIEALQAATGTQRPPAAAVMPTRPQTSVLVAHADPDALDAVMEALSLADDLALVGVAQTPYHALTLAARHRPNVALVDENMTAGGGARLAASVAEASADTRIVGIIGAPDVGAALGMIAAGATSVLSDAGDAPALLAAIRRTARGGSDLSASVAPRVLEHVRFDPTVDASIPRRRFERLRRILAEGELEMALQPIVSLADRRACGFEALARFSGTPQRPPDVWFAEAQRAGLGLELELLAARSALALLDYLPGDAFLAVNVSPHTATRPELADLIGTRDAPRVVLEITEHAPVEDYEELRTALDVLRRRGTRIAVDDCGSGFASLRHVAMIGPEFLKLDALLCRDVSEPVRAALTRALLAFAEDTASAVVAEGVERPEDLEALLSLGVRLGQGYLFDRPRPAAQFSGAR